MGTGLGWGLLLHGAWAGVTQLCSADAWAGLVSPRRLHSHEWCSVLFSVTKRALSFNIIA